MANFNVKFSSSQDMNMSFGSSHIIDTRNVLVNTTAAWNTYPTFVAEKDIVYVYTDHKINSDGQAVPGFKVGDGKAYLIDLPFNDDIMEQHEADSEIHVSPEDREFWDNKVTAFTNADDPENLILSKI